MLTVILAITYLLLSLLSYFVYCSYLSFKKQDDWKIELTKYLSYEWIFLSMVTYPLIALAMVTGFFQYRARGSGLILVSNILAICDLLLLVGLANVYFELHLF